MNRPLLLLLFYICLSLCCLPASVADTLPAGKEKCKKAEKLLGTWYGRYDYAATGTHFMLIMEVEKVSGCTVEGSLHWPDFFNCKSGFKGDIIDNKLIVREHEVVQGYNMKYVSRLEVPLSSFDTLRGSWIGEEDNLMAGCYMLNEAKFSPSQKDSVAGLVKEYARKYGTVTFPSAQEKIGQEQFLVQYQKFNDKSGYSLDALEMRGTMNIGKMQAPMYMLFRYPGLVYMELEIQNLKFLAGNNGKESWEYNPLEEKLEVKEVKEGEGGQENMGFQEQELPDLLRNGYEIKKISPALLDSISAYRVLLQKAEEDELVFFFDKRNFQLVRKEQNYKIDLYYRHQKINGYYVPRLYYQIEGKEVMNFQFTEIRPKPGLSDSVFQVPAALKNKIVKASAEKDSNYFNDRGVEKHEKGDFEGAIEEYSKAIRLNSRMLVYYQNRGKARKETGDYYGAISDYNVILEHEPKNAEVINLLGVAKYALGDYQNAEKDFSRALKYDSTLLQAYSNRGLANFQLGEPEKALEDFKVVVNGDSTNGEAWYSHGALLVQLENYPEAIESYSQAIKFGYDNADTYNRRGVAYFSHGDFEKALADFRKSVSLDESDYIKYQNLGNTLAELGDFKKSNAAYEKALELAEKNEKAEILNRLGLNYYAMEAYGAAREKFNEAIKLNDKNAQYYDNRARAKTDLNDFSGAIEDYSTSLSLYPDDPEIHIQRGLLYANLHNRHQGCKDFKKAQELGHEQAQKLIEEYCQLGVGKE